MPSLKQDHPVLRAVMIAVGLALFVGAGVIAPLPGPGGVFLFAAGLAFILPNSAWARRWFVRLKRRWPWGEQLIDRVMRRPSVARRRARDAELTSEAPSLNAPDNEAADAAALLRSETRELHDEADLSAVEPGAGPSPRLPQPHGDAGRPQRDSRTPRTRPQEAVGLTGSLADPVGKVSTLRRRRDFLAANRGKRAPMPGFVLLMHRRDDGDPAMRVGFTVTKKIGNAVVRNRMKRRLRALSRELLPTGGVPGADHILIGREGGIERDYDLLRAELAKALAKVSRP